MSELVIPAGSNIVDAAFAKVTLTSETAGAIGGNLQKLSTKDFVAAASEVWERVRTVLNQAARDGWVSVQKAVVDLGQFVEERAAELYDDAAQFRQLLLDKLHELMRETVDIVLRSVRSRITVGEDIFVLRSIDLETKIVYSGSIEASITAICKFLGSGETVVKGKYSILGSTQDS